MVITKDVFILKLFKRCLPIFAVIMVISGCTAEEYHPISDVTATRDTESTSVSTTSTTQTTTTTVTTTTTTAAPTTTTTTKQTTTTTRRTTTTTTKKVTTTTAAAVTHEGAVYITPSGECYHLDPECGGKNAYQVSWDVALTRRPCKKCAK